VYKKEAVNIKSVVASKSSAPYQNYFLGNFWLILALFFLLEFLGLNLF